MKSVVTVAAVAFGAGFWGILVAANEAVRIHNSWGMTKDPVTVL